MPDGEFLTAYELNVVEKHLQKVIKEKFNRHYVSGRWAHISDPQPIHLQPCYAGLGYGPGTFPVTEAAAQRILSLPMYAELTQDQIGIVADTLGAFINE